jgi:hypothetical protein
MGRAKCPYPPKAKPMSPPPKLPKSRWSKKKGKAYAFAQ